MDWESKAALFCSSVIGQFHSRTQVEGRKQGVDFGITLKTAKKGGAHWFTFSKNDEEHSFSVPILFEENRILFIEQNEVRRAVCPYFIKTEDMILDYYSIMQRIVLDSPAGLVESIAVKKSPFIQQIVWSFANGNTSAIIYNLQRAINEIVNKMPLHDTLLNSYVMNHRLIIVDPRFKCLQNDPALELEYQINKNREFFDRGWTSIGLPDGTLVDRNYLLTIDIRHLAPFGMKYHNPQRNLYSTLGMKGDELPNVRSQTQQELINAGIVRKGWNLTTLFVDVPDVFEDQIMVDISHQSKFINYRKRYQCYGALKVEKGQKIKKGQTLSISDKATTKRFDVLCDSAVVHNIEESVANVGGVETPVYNVIISYRRYLRDGVKFTNMHGNKGVIRMKELGYAVDPRTGETRKIDVIVSARTIRKRKNPNQLLEAIVNNITPDDQKPIVIDDHYSAPMEYVKESLKNAGFPEDGTWFCETYVGPLTGVCGEVFWGVIGSVENSLWSDEATVRRNVRDLRTAGLKFSHVEIRALQTRFGKDNPIIDEVLSYAQGREDIIENIRILESRTGKVPNDVPKYSVDKLKFVNQSSGTIVDEEFIKGTIVDEHFEPDGFVVQLPITYQVVLDENNKSIYEGVASTDVSSIVGDVEKVFVSNEIYAPKAALRRCWRHDNGKWGLSEIGVLLNNILIVANRYTSEPTEPRHLSMLYRAVSVYFKKVAHIMSTKRGDVSRLGMAVRYPFSSKAKATLCNRIPANTVEIHSSMANSLDVGNGDVVLVERFPCLGFMSIRPQKIKVTEDEMARYTIRVSGSSLCSTGLDFDGDDIYIASFHTPEAKMCLKKEWESPNPVCYKIIEQLNSKAGKPRTASLTLDDYNIKEFEPLNVDTHASIVEKAAGVKSHTGPVIALAYNIMRILENSDICDRQETNVAIEYFLDRVGNTVFKQKHGVKALHEIVTEAICTGNVETLVNEGFDRNTSETIIGVIKRKAAQVGISNMAAYHKIAKERKWSNAINRIVRHQNKVYYASRADLSACELLAHLYEPAVDVPSRMFKDIIEGKIGTSMTKMEEYMTRSKTEDIKDPRFKEVCKHLLSIVDNVTTPAADTTKDECQRAKECLTRIVLRASK
jgi:hypothetical protein